MSSKKDATPAERLRRLRDEPRVARTILALKRLPPAERKWAYDKILPMSIKLGATDTR